METSFKYKYYKGVIIRTVVFLLIMLSSIYLYFRLSGNTYIAAWILGVVVALTIFVTLSIPRHLRVTDKMLEIRCLLEMTRISMEDIVSVNKIEKRDLKWVIPIVASCGFCGHFGIYLDLRSWNTLKVYATSWQDLVVIEDIYEDLYVVNCQRADEFVELVIGARNARRKQVQISEQMNNQSAAERGA